VQPHLDAAKLDLGQRDRAFDSLNHAGGHGGEEKLGRVEGVRPPVHLGVEDDLRILAAGTTAESINPLGCDVVFQHYAPRSVGKNLTDTFWIAHAILCWGRPHPFDGLYPWPS
jgi:hypothetical protein